MEDQEIFDLDTVAGLKVKDNVKQNYFLRFLDKVKELTPSKKMNEVILRKLSDVNVDLLSPKSILNAFQKHSKEF